MNGTHEQVQEIERRLRQWHSEDEASRRIAEITIRALLAHERIDQGT
jgi:hypothetical protein